MCQSTTSRALNSMFLSRSQDYFVSVHLWRTALQLGLKTIRINPVPLCPNFYILPAHFRIFRQIWNWYKIRDVKFEKGAEMVWLVSRSFSYFPGYPIFINSVCTVFITMCVAMAMNLLNHLSVDLWVATIYYTTKCMTVNLFVKLWIIIMVYNYLCYYHLSIIFIYSCRVCWMIGYRTGQCASVLTFRRLFAFDTYPFELVHFLYPVSRIHFRVQLFYFRYHFCIKIQKWKW